MQNDKEMIIHIFTAIFVHRAVWVKAREIYIN